MRALARGSSTRCSRRRWTRARRISSASNLEIVSVDVGNPATNVIPGEVRVGLQHPLQRRLDPRRRSRPRSPTGRGDAGGADRTEFRSRQRGRRFSRRAALSPIWSRARSRRSTAARRSFRRAAALRTRVSSRTPARSSSSGWSARRCTGSTSMRRSTISRRCRRSTSASSRFTFRNRGRFAGGGAL